MNTQTLPIKPMHPNPTPPAFARRDLSEIIQRGNVGYQYTQGIHIYCELRVVESLYASKTDEQALKLLQALNDYVHYGVIAANPFKVDLLEVQGTLLHFYREGEASAETVIDVVRFAHIFTTVLYDRLKNDLGDDWRGFGTCIDFGPSIIVRHGTFSNSSAVSLGTAANRPAKQLLYGKTPAGCIDVPSVWATFFGRQKPSTNWLSINLKDKEWLPFATKVEDAELRQKFIGLADRYGRERRSVFNRLTTLNSTQIHTPGGVTVDAPYRVTAFVNRFDLDGFSKTVEDAFLIGGKAIDEVAQGFGRILEFGEYMRETTPGAIRLPWAGDCCSLIIPPDATGSLSNLRTTRWLQTAVRWQGFASGDKTSLEKKWATTFSKVAWAVGAACGESTSCLLAQIQTDSRQFLIGVGWPFAASLEGQNLGKGGEVLVHSQDYNALPEGVKKLFTKVPISEFWKAANLTKDKLDQAQISGATSKPVPAAEYSSKLSSLYFPTQRPHCQ